MELQAQRVALVVAALAASCGPPPESDVDAFVGQDAPVDPDASVPCGTGECRDCLDNDRDGRVDSADPDCTHEYDDREQTLFLGIADICQDLSLLDCYFDGNEGSGDDGCLLHRCCVLDVCPPELVASFDPGMCVVTAECQAACLPLTLPGCDCFGCCTICGDGACVNALIECEGGLGGSCETAADALAGDCPACTPSSACRVPCGADNCAVCLGMTDSDLPGACEAGRECPPGRTLCELDSDCGPAEYCGNRCCTPSNG